jgi:hypothetical protein
MFMRKYLGMLLIVMMTFTLSSCEVIGDIFSAGFYAGIFVVVLVVAIVIWLLAKLRRRR